MTIYEKLMTIQQKLNAPKNQRNSFGNYNYRSCEDILEALKPLLKETKTVINLSDKVEAVGDRVYIHATATLVDIEGGEVVFSDAYAREEADKKGMDASQVTGAASSYARKYALNGLFAIDDNKDADATNTHSKEAKKSAPKAEDVPMEDLPFTFRDEPGGEPAVFSGKKVCSVCGAEMTDKVADYSKQKFGKYLCYNCQKKR